jgi:hypothetical protein
MNPADSQIQRSFNLRFGVHRRHMNLLAELHRFRCAFTFSHRDAVKTARSPSAARMTAVEALFSSNAFACAGKIREVLQR